MQDELVALRAEVERLRHHAERWRIAEDVLQLGVWEHDLTSDACYCSEATMSRSTSDPTTGTSSA